MGEMFKRRQRESIIRLFYAGDVHGSRLCWKKFVNAAAHYPADALIMGGDLTGKALVPIVRVGDGTYQARVIAYNNDFRLMALVVLPPLVLLLFMRRHVKPAS